MNLETVDVGQKIIRGEKSSFFINLDRSRNLWSISVSDGQVPVALRGNYTNPGVAQTAIKNYVDNREERSITYKNKKKED